jgi:hypothetical protein
MIDRESLDRAVRRLDKETLVSHAKEHLYSLLLELGNCAELVEAMLRQQKP